MRFSIRDILIVTAVVAAALRIGAYLADPLAGYANGVQNEALAMDTENLPREYPTP